MKTIVERIASHPFFQGMKPEHLAIAASGATEATASADEVIFREREPASRFYLIEGGSIALEAHEPGDGNFAIQTLGPGEVLGWSWLFPPFVWHFQARALEPTQMIVLNGAHLLVTAERDRNFGYELSKRVTQVLIHRLQATRKQLVKAQQEFALKG